jgi:hypothetical protein
MILVKDKKLKFNVQFLLPVTIYKNKKTKKIQPKQFIFKLKSVRIHPLIQDKPGYKKNNYNRNQ